MAIRLSQINFAYDISKKTNVSLNFTLHDINLEINLKDEMIAFVGHTGSGKSTLVQLLNALLLPTIGKISIEDNDKTFVLEKKLKDKFINDDHYKQTKKYRKFLLKSLKHNIKLKELRKKIGLVFQFPEYQIFEETVLKDIMFGPKNFSLSNEEAKIKAKEIAERMKITDLLDKSPFALSGGQMRKVAIAGILASNPDVLILDEPTVGLDPQTKEELLTFLVDLKNTYHKTIILITHDMDVISKYIERVIVLKKGTIMYDGSKIDLFKNKELIESCNLDYPTIVSIMMHLKEYLNLNDLDVYQYNLDDAMNEIERCLGDNHE